MYEDYSIKRTDGTLNECIGLQSLKGAFAH